MPASKLRVGVITFPGSNCDRDASFAWEELGIGQAISLWHQEDNLHDVDVVIIPGGFSYGDALRTGAVARLAPIMKSVAGFAAEGGLVMGICNGFQILCEAGLLPGALVRNERLRFICRSIYLRTETVHSPFTCLGKPGGVLSMPIAHGEGRYICSEDTAARLLREDRILFRYCNAMGEVIPDVNPNGSYEGIAGILGGPRRNVLGMMPHPERATFPALGSADGQVLFDSIRHSLVRREALVET